MEPNKFLGRLDLTEGVTTAERSEAVAQPADAVPDAVLQAFASSDIATVLYADQPERIAEPDLPFAGDAKFGLAAFRASPNALNGGVPERPEYPNGVPAHLNSHHAQLTNLVASGEIPAQFEPVLRLFIELHDRGYAGEKGPMSVEDYERDVMAFYETYLDLGATEVQGQQMVQYVGNGLRNANPGLMHLLGRVIPHGVNSVRYGRQVLEEEAGLSKERALALAKLFATHHFGEPIDGIVTAVAARVGSPVPPELRETFFIGGEETNDKDVREQRANALRARIADEVAPVLGISTQDSRAIAAIAYALDRMSPARRMRDFTLNTDGSVVWTGGETEKRYPLVVRNMPGYIADPSAAGPVKADLASVYGLSSNEFRTERNAAIRTANALGVQGLERVIRGQSDREIGETDAIQNRALAVANRLGVGNDLRQIDADIARVTAEYRRAESEPQDDDDREALGYLLGTLKAIEPTVKQFFVK